MNRLHHLSITLPQNVLDNNDYFPLEFVILDYHSSDGLQQWVYDHLKDHLATGRVVYYRTTEPVTFHRSHSRNLAFKLGTGDILCNLDADNFTGAGFAAYINELFMQHENIFLTPIDFARKMNGFNPLPDTLGRICVRRDAFYAVRGYNEAMETHGFQDYDFANRIEMAGSERLIIDRPAFLQAITHDDNERISNKQLRDELQGIYMRYKTHFETDILYLYVNNKFETGTLVDARLYHSPSYQYAYTQWAEKYRYRLKESNWVTGTWENMGNGQVKIQPATGGQQVFHIAEENSQLTTAVAGDVFYALTKQELISQIRMFNLHWGNRSIMLDNLRHRRIVTNGADFGKSTVYRNFDTENSIRI
jgi:hypothetical protein